MKKIIISLICFILYFSFVLNIFAASNYPLEVEYPAIEDIATPISRTFPVALYFKYIVYFVLAAGGIFALGVIIKAGFNYLTSTGIPERMKDAQNQITAAILGLVILLGSWLILNAINPNILNFDLAKLKPIVAEVSPGIYVCKPKADGKEVNVADIWQKIKEAKEKKEEEQIKESAKIWLNEIKEYCWFISFKLAKLPSDEPQKFEDEITSVYTIPSKTYRYGAILYENSDFQGKAQVIYSPYFKGVSFSVDKNRLGVSSVKPFIINNEVRPGWYVKLFERTQWETKDDKGKKSNWKQYPPAIASCYNLKDDFPIKEEKDGLLTKKHQFQSVDIEGELIVIFFKDRTCNQKWDETTELYVLTEDDGNLEDNLPIGQWCENTDLLIFTKEYPCAKGMVIVSGKTY